MLCCQTAVFPLPLSFFPSPLSGVGPTTAIKIFAAPLGWSEVQIWYRNEIGTGSSSHKVVKRLPSLLSGEGPPTAIGKSYSAASRVFFRKNHT